MRLFVVSIPCDTGAPLRFQRPTCNPDVPAATRRNRLAQLARPFSSMSGVSLGEQYLKMKLVLSTWSFQSFQLTEWLCLLYFQNNRTYHTISIWGEFNTVFKVLLSFLQKVRSFLDTSTLWRTVWEVVLLLIRFSMFIALPFCCVCAAVRSSPKVQN